jgi:transposase InsO family protein
VLRRPLEFAQFVSLAFGQQARAAGIAQSMGSKGDCFDTQLMMAPVALRYAA